jgi:phosphodiesterase/alkaline phosphatase D-like protein
MRKIVLTSLLASLAVASIAWADTTPAVVTGAATAVSSARAVLHATVNPGGAATSYSFESGPTTAYGAVSTTGKAGRGATPLEVTRMLTGLTPGTVYHYAIQASNNLGSAIGRDRVLMTTGHPPPGAVTGVPSAVATTTATLTGAVVTQGQATSAYFQWGTAPTYGYQTAATDVTAATTPQPVSYTLTGLAPGTTFHYRLVAIHAGVAPQVGADQAFTTIPLVRFRDRVTARTTPRRARRRPFLFTTAGTVVPAVALPPGVGCTGLVYVRFMAGARAVAFRRVPLQSNCTFGTQVGFRHRIGHQARRLRVVVRFHGNPYLRPASARTRRAELG